MAGHDWPWLARAPEDESGRPIPREPKRVLRCRRVVLAAQRGAGGLVAFVSARLALATPDGPAPPDGFVDRSGLSELVAWQFVNGIFAGGALATAITARQLEEHCFPTEDTHDPDGPEADEDDFTGIVTYSVCALPDYDPHHRFFFSDPTGSCGQGSLVDTPDDDVCNLVEDTTCDLGESVFGQTIWRSFAIEFERVVTYCARFVCEAGERCSCPECAGNEFCWPTCGHSAGEGTLCDAPGGSPSPSGTWCCPLVYDCAEEPPLTCEPT